MRCAVCAVRDLHAGADQAGGDHAPAHRFAVQQPPVVRFCLQRVADGVSEIQDAALAAFPLVGAYHLGFHPNAFGDQSLQQRAIAPQQSVAVRLHQLEDRRIANHAILHRLK